MITTGRAWRRAAHLMREREVEGGEGEWEGEGGREEEREEGEEGEREGDREEGRGEREGQGEREEGQEGEAEGGGEKRKREKRSRRGGGGSLIAYQGRHRQMVHALGSEPQEIILGKTNQKQGKILTMSNSKVSCREERSVYSHQWTRSRRPSRIISRYGTPSKRHKWTIDFCCGEWSLFSPF